MIAVISNAWALLLGMLLLMVGNGLQGTLLGVRGEIEQFSTLEMSVVMSAYFVGFLFSSRMTPELIRMDLAVPTYASDSYSGTIPFIHVEEFQNLLGPLGIFF